MSFSRRVLLTLAGALLALGPTAAPAGAAPSAPPPGPLTPATTLTLITGDRVVVHPRPGHAPDVVVRPAPGREHLPFGRSVDRRGRVSVIPFDAQVLLARGKLNPALFDVTTLLDRTHGTQPLPLLVSYTGARKALAGSKLKRDIPALSASAVSVRPADATAFWAALDPKAPNQASDLTAGIAKVSLDGTAKPLDVDSVRQVGAPAAWHRGLTAKGVKVAILDTGVDIAHPDLTGRIAQTKDFTDSSDGVKDTVGHGTHVAGIIAGTGPQPGVAPGADLLIGRVCEDSGCDDSAIMAGMAWAAQSGAKVVNLSLGGDPTDGTDDVSQAVDTLSAKYGVLFVIAAGNDGADSSVDSPGSADAALTVGSVTKDGQLSWYSSRGPRLGDNAVKPEISAPGYAIVAARAAGTTLGYPLGDRYTQLSGTSMATPHVTAAAAILAGEHPDWSPARLKATLTGTAQPISGAGVFGQGTGVVNVDRATTASVMAEPATLDLTTTKTASVTYRNDGAAPVRLDLTLPAGITAGRTSVTVPAHGTAPIALTARATDDHGAVVLAHGSGISLRTAVSAHSVPVTHEITVSTVDRNGQPNGTGGYGFQVTLFSHAENVYYGGSVFNGYNMSGSIPAGRYTAFAWIPSTRPGHPPWEPSNTLVAQDVTLDQDVSLTLDARLGRLMATTLNGTQGTGYDGTSFGAPGLSALAMQSDETYVATESSPGMIYTAVQFVRGVAGTTTCGPDGARVCALATASANGLVATHPVLTDRDLATVKTTAGGTGGADRVDFVEAPGSTPPPGEPMSDDGEFTLPGTLTSYYHSDGPITWHSFLTEVKPDYVTLQGATGVAYQAGKTYQESWNLGVLAPSVSAAVSTRDGNLLNVDLALLSDPAAGHFGAASGIGADGRTALYRNGKLYSGELSPDGTMYQVPPEAARYRITASAVKPTGLSTKVDVAWEFGSRKTSGDTALPMLAVRFTPPLDASGSAPANSPFAIPFTVDHTATASAIRNVTVDASFDDGVTWTKTLVVLAGDHGVLTLDHPAGAHFVALRAHARDTAGDTVDQTVLRAYPLK